MFYFAFEPYATYLINNIHLLTQDSLLPIYFMFGSTLNIFSVKAKLWPLELGGGFFFTVWNCNWPKMLYRKVFLFTCIGLERHTPKSWIGPKQQITRIMYNVRFLTPILIKILYLGCVMSLCQRRTDYSEQLVAAIFSIYAVHGQ